MEPLAGRKRREVEGVAILSHCPDGATVPNAAVPQRPIALVIQLPNHMLSSPLPAAQTVVTGSDRYLLEVIKLALCEVLKWADLELDTLRAMWHAFYYYAHPVPADKGLGCPRLGHDPCEPCQLKACARDNARYLAWLHDGTSVSAPPVIPRDYTIVPLSTCPETGETKHWTAVCDDEEDAPKPHLQYLSTRQNKHTALLRAQLSKDIRGEDDFGKMLRRLQRLYDYPFPAGDWYVGVAAQADESRYFSRLCSFPATMQRHDELAAQRKAAAAESRARASSLSDSMEGVQVGSPETQPRGAGMSSAKEEQ